MTKRIRLAALAVAATAIPAVLAGCAASNGGSSTTATISIVGFSVLKTANEPVIADFQKTDAGKDVKFTTSYGASGDQSRAVAGACTPTRCTSRWSPTSRRWSTPDWSTRAGTQTPTQGILTDSEVVFLVRKGNPLGIKTWDDLVKPGVKIITPNPASSGSAKWNILAAWAHAANGPGGNDAKAEAFVTKLLDNTVALPGSGSDALSSFVAGNGDVLLAYENDSIEARAAGDDVDYILPDDTLLIQNPVALTTDATAAARTS